MGAAIDLQAYGIRQVTTQRGGSVKRDRPSGVCGGGGVHLLHPVAVRAVDVLIVEVDEVRIPAGVAVLGEQRRVGRHVHHVAVQFHAAHERRFGQAVDELGVPGAVFAEVDLRALAVGVIVVVEVVKPPAGGLVGMLVHDRNAGLARIRPTLLVVLSARRRPDRADHGDFGVRGFDGVENLLEAVLEHVVDQVLVADAEILQIERLDMAHCGALGGPLVGGRIGVAEVDEAQHFVDVSGHVFLSHRHRALAGVLAAHAGRQHGQRLGSDGLAQAKVLVETDTERLVVAPYVEVVRAMLHRADGAVPVIHVVQAQSVGDAAAREAHEARV